MKHTNLVLFLVIVGLVAAARALARDWQAAGRALGSALVLLCVHWVLAGQHLANLPSFIRGAFWFSEGYNEAMVLQEPRMLTWIGAGIVVLLGVISWLRGIWGGLGPFVAILNSAFAFIAWKHCFVRADPEHMAVLFYAAFFFTPLFAFGGAPHQAPQDESPRWLREGVPVAAIVVIVLALVGMQNGIADMAYRPMRLFNHWSHSARWLLSPSAQTHAMEESLADAREENRLDGVREVVADATIDQFGHQPGFVLLNELNYSPRPMPITFAAANPGLLRANEAHYRSTSAPDYVLALIGAIDGRLTSQDDGLALGALLENYTPVLTDGPHLLLKRTPTVRAAAAWTLVRGVEATLGDAVSLEGLDQAFLWMTADVRPTLLGRLRSLLYKAPEVFIHLEFEDGTTGGRRLVTSMARTPFIVQPFIDSNPDLLNAYYRREPRTVTSLRIDVADAHRLYFEPGVDMRLYEGPAPPVGH
jgi:hypothetical protein